ncbi:MAG: bifunctional phosphoserine phosphatase/homoserine phosphotransferase ThrH [Opitutae bacterium]|nr:bifunctional phosphoserine phosphatase/homoserine phosphotransferase ThrH [Opitutae bacterium]
MQVVCLDLEGVLIPEIWVAFAEKTQVEELKRTTRDEPDYQKLMNYRLKILDKHGFKLPQIQEVIESMDPLPGAIDFVSKLRESHELIILSDTFREFALPLMRKLNFPTLFCHELQIADDGKIEKVKIRLEDHKRKSVQYFQKLNFRVSAAGDSYNDLGMLLAADRCAFYNPPKSITVEYPDIHVTTNFESLFQFIEG